MQNLRSMKARFRVESHSIDKLHTVLAVYNWSDINTVVNVPQVKCKEKDKLFPLVGYWKLKNKKL